jgi:hypothetical protein
VSDSERVEPIRSEIDQARAATDRFRAKASELIADLREREAEARRDAVIAHAASQEAGQGRRLRTF